MLSDTQLSDLFFNHQHPNYDALMIPSLLKMGSTHAYSVIREAIAKDAAEFADDFKEFGKDADWYTEDFMRRL